MAQENRFSEYSESHPGCKRLREEALREGVLAEDDLPFMLCPDGAKTAALLIHGFTATPWEMRPLAEALAEADIASLAIRLPGHGTSPEDLANRRWEEWYSAVIRGHQILSNDFSITFGMGMSTGCLLLLSIARELPLQALVLFSPYLRVLHKLAPYAGWLRWIRAYQEKSTEDSANGHYYNRRPVAGMHQINQLIKNVKSKLPHIHCPVLAFNGEGDQTVDIKSGRHLVDLMGSAVKIYEQYGPAVPHVLTGENNPCRDMMFDQTVNFIEKLEYPCREEQ